MSMTEGYWSPSKAAGRLSEDDRQQGMDGFVAWFREVEAAGYGDLSTLPERAFLAGYAWSSQFRWE